ncbi:hypothetical protein CBL_04542 [Carabus blaptoides fortunei]
MHWLRDQPQISCVHKSGLWFTNDELDWVVRPLSADVLEAEVTANQKVKAMSANCGELAQHLIFHRKCLKTACEHVRNMTWQRRIGGILPRPTDASLKRRRIGHASNGAILKFPRIS